MPTFKEQLKTHLTRLTPDIKEALQDTSLFNLTSRPNARTIENWIEQALDVERIKDDPEGWLLALDSPAMVKHLRLEMCTNKYDTMKNYLKELGINSEQMNQALNVVEQEEVNLSHLTFNSLGVLPKHFGMHSKATFLPNVLFNVEVLKKNEALALLRSTQQEVVTPFKEKLGVNPTDNKFSLDLSLADSLLVNFLAYRTASYRRTHNPDSLVLDYLNKVDAPALQALFYSHGGEAGYKQFHSEGWTNVSRMSESAQRAEDQCFALALVAVCYKYFPDSLREKHLSDTLKSTLCMVNDGDGHTFSERLVGAYNYMALSILAIKDPFNHGLPSFNQIVNTKFREELHVLQKQYSPEVFKKANLPKFEQSLIDDKNEQMERQTSALTNVFFDLIETSQPLEKYFVEGQPPHSPRYGRLLISSEPSSIENCNVQLTTTMKGHRYKNLVEEISSKAFNHMLTVWKQYKDATLLVNTPNKAELLQEAQTSLERSGR